MTKTKKQRNHVLIRRVKRTSAAILLVMAVVVAAIPVENLGTVQAELNTTFDMSTYYSTDMSNIGSVYNADGNNYFYSSDDFDTSDTNSQVTIQQVSSDSTPVVSDTYIATLAKSGSNSFSSVQAIVSGYGDTGSITIDAEECYDLVMFTISNNSLSSTLSNLGTLSVTFTDESNVTTGNVSLTNTYYYLDTDTEKSNLQQLSSFSDSVTTVYPLSSSYTGSDINLPNKVQSETLAKDYSHSYDSLYTTSDTVNSAALIKQCESDALQTYIDGTLASYNSDINTLISICNKMNAGSQSQPAILTQAQVELWTAYYQDYSTKKTAAASFSIDIDDCTDADGNGLYDVYDYVITQHYGKSSSLTLKNYELVQAKYSNSQNGSTGVYLLELNGTKDNGQTISDEGYLCVGKAEIVGIATSAFVGSDVNSVTINGGVTFIGEKAFYKCTNLTSVTINKECKYIGDEAFAESNLKNVTFSVLTTSSALTAIGVNAFYFTNITNVEIPASVTEICAGAFSFNHYLEDVTFSNHNGTNMKIGAYAFYNCEALEEVTFGSTTRVYEIGKGAFSLSKQYSEADHGFGFSFPKGNTKIVYDDDVDCDKSTGSNDDDYDYILAGRVYLEYVEFASIADTIPANTLRGCYQLGYAVFGTSTADYDSYNSSSKAQYDTQLFSDVTNTSFYATGPAYKSDNKTTASPRASSWTGILGYKVDDDDEYYAPVPYMYTIGDTTYIDLGYSGGQYVATLEVTSDTTAVLSKYFENTETVTQTTERVAITIPSQVGNYTITAIGDDCFSDKTLRKRVYKITIEDGGILSIGDRAFENCINLEWVYIGSSVSYIGEDAFAGCTRLENVEFSQTITSTLGDAYDDDEWADLLTIETGAFNTQSDYLTFHGTIHSGYAPFELAMGSTSSKMTNTGAHICYKTDEPLNLTVIRNDDTGEATLVDYPHYDEIDTINSEYILYTLGKESSDSYSITGVFESYLNDNTQTEPTSGETAIVEATLYLDLPTGIESVDSASFFASADDVDSFYVNYQYIFDSSDVSDTSASYSYSDDIYDATQISTGIRTSDSLKITSLYAEDKYPSADSYYAYVYEIDDVATGGLFSGWFNEADYTADNSYSDTSTNNLGYLLENGVKYGSHTYVNETYNSGNDYLTSVDMPTVTSLPDYAFDSCENLLTAAFGEDMTSIGALPFRGCKAVYDVDFGTDLSSGGSTNGYYAFQNMILYQNNGDDTNTDYEIIELLEGRGAGRDDDGNYYGTISITSSEILDNVSSIAEAAFSNNTYLNSVDLSETTIKEVPVDCFENDSNLTYVDLPSTIRTIDSGALATGGSTLNLSVPTGNCTISTDVMYNDDNSYDGTILYISGVAYDDDGSYSNLYYSYLDLVDTYGENKVFFIDIGNSYTITFYDMDLNIIDGYSYTIEIKSGETYSLSTTEIAPAPTVSGYDFEYWMCNVDGTVYTGTSVGDDAFTGIAESRIYYPYYVANPSSVVSDGTAYTLQFTNCTAYDATTLTNLSSGTTVYGGDTIVFTASDSDTFMYWTVAALDSTDTTDYASNLTSVSAYITSFTMPNASVKVTANLTTSSGSSGSSSSDSDDDDDDDDDDDEDTYTLTVNYGSGSGEYEAGTKVTIAAYAPESSTKVFSKWTSTNSDVGFASATAATTTLVMPSEDVTVTANYKTRTSDDDDDDDDDDSSSSSGRTSVASTTTTANGTNGSGSSTTTTSTTTTTVSGSDDDGNKIYITKNGISNKDVASITVEGSTDNFIVRISESDEATEAAKLALTNEYGSLDNLVYFPMDISLYDATGQNKITDSYGLNITVTMPIPDVLIQYGGNARVAACDDGVLTQITPKFTTIDGIACISFTPPHFSPYVIYVDTSNLTAGTLDSTPKTGDPIHPKWFLAIGLGCASVVLFATSDGRKRRKFRTV